MKKVPTYDLEHIKELLQKEDTRAVTNTARQGAVTLGYADDVEMANRVSQLTVTEFYKTMPSKQVTELMQDVYYTKDGLTKLYIKLQIACNGKAVIVSFKERDDV